MPYKGSCHCGRIAFEVEGVPEAALACNCSICSRKGALLWAVPRETLRLLTPEDAMSGYTFNRHAIVHRFCKTCGLHPFAEDADAEDGGDADGRSAYINLRCLEGFDPGAIEVVEFDGRAM